MMNSLTASQISAISGLSAFSSVLSLCGSSFIIVCYLAFPNLRKLSFSLVFLMSISDFWNQIFDLISPSTEDLVAMEANPNLVTPTCLAQAIGDNFFELSSVLWTTAIAWTLYATVMWRWQIEDSYRNWAK
jgi:cAMP receptor-like G-protein coupled receptor